MSRGRVSEYIAFIEGSDTLLNTYALAKITSSQNTKITAQIRTISSQLTVKLLLVMSSLFSAPPKYNICKRAFNKAPSTFYFIWRIMLLSSQKSEAMQAIRFKTTTQYKQ